MHFALRLPQSRVISDEHIKVIAVHISESESIVEDELATFGWDDLDTYASALSALRTVVVGFHSRSDMDLFARVALPSMPKLQRANKLKYAMSEGE